MINIIYIEKHPISRKGFRSIFKNSDEINLIGTYKSIGDAELILNKNKIDVLVFGVNSISNKINTKKILKIISLDYNILLFGEYSHTEKIYFINKGVKGFLSKEASIKEIRNAIYKLSKSEIYIPMGTPNLMNYSNKKSIKRILSRREKEVLNLLFKGEKNSLIADKLNINPKTVYTYKQRALKKLNVKEIINAYSLIVLDDSI